MDNTTKANETEVSFDVLNALNLLHPYLGEAYSNFKWNPFGEDFSLDIPFIEKYLESARYKPETKAPAFLEQNPKKVLESFKTAEKNNKVMLEDLKKMLENGEFKNFKGADITPQIKDILFFLECRQKMLEISIGQLTAKQIDALKALKNINSINRKLSELLEEAYMKDFQKNVALNNMILQAQIQNKLQKQNAHKLSETFMNILKKSHLYENNQTFTPEKDAKEPDKKEKTEDSSHEIEQVSKQQEPKQEFQPEKTQTTEKSKPSFQTKHKPLDKNSSGKTPQSKNLSDPTQTL